MATIKIRGRREPITVDDTRARKIKVLRFGDVNGKGKADPHEDLDLGDEWAGTIGMVEWVELGKAKEIPKFKVIRRLDTPDRVFQVPVNYQLKAGEELA